MDNAYSYVRMSTEGQLKGDSLRRQLDLSRKYAEAHELNLVEEAFHDIGVSAFKGKNSTTGALSRFIALVDSGQIARGSYLLVESLDRLSREKTTAALEQFLSLTRKGITIVTLADNQVYGEDVDFTQLIISIAIMSRANEESRMKSFRLAEVWDAKRSNATKTKLTAMCPSWLSLSDDRATFLVNKERAAIVKWIFERTIAGQGANSLTRELNNSETPSFGNPKGWIESYVKKILRQRAVLGEFQPHHFVDGERLPKGDPIADYYPRIIEDDIFFAAQAAIAGRRSSSAGRRGLGYSNLFSGLACCHYCGAKMKFKNKGLGPKGGRYLQCTNAARSAECAAPLWRYDHFEQAVLTFVNEIDLDALLRSSDGQHSREANALALDAAKGELILLKERRETIFELTSKANTDFVAGKLIQIESDITRIEREINRLSVEEQALTRQPQSGEELKAQITRLQNSENENAYELRMRLAAQLRRTLKSLTLQSDGGKRSRERTLAMVEAEQMNASEKAELIEMLQATWKARDSWPTFTVVFPDDSARQVAVNPKDATDYKYISDVDGDGARVKWEGREDWVATW